MGETSKTVQVSVNGDTDVEGSETVLLNLSAATNGAVIIDSTGRGVIANDDIALVKIYSIQGAGHVSPLVGQHVFTEGVVTAIDTTGSRGFWIQDETGDGDAATSDAVFVFTNADPSSLVHVGDKVHVEGDVTEFQGADANNLTITEVGATLANISVVGTGSIAPTIIGAGGLHPPTEVIEDDGFTTFQPAQDGADFYESLEGMMVTIKNAQVVDSTAAGSTWVIADGGANVTGENLQGGVTITAQDFNPERIQIYYDSGIAGAGAQPNATTGENLGDVTGVVTYFGGNYEVHPTAVGSTGTGATVPREVTTLTRDAEHVTIAAYNVENLDPTDPQAKFDRLAQDIGHQPGLARHHRPRRSPGCGRPGGRQRSERRGDAEQADRRDRRGGRTSLRVRRDRADDAEQQRRRAGRQHPASLPLQPRSGAVREGSADLLEGDAYVGARHPLMADFTFHRRDDHRHRRPQHLGAWAASSSRRAPTRRQRRRPAPHRPDHADQDLCGRARRGRPRRPRWSSWATSTPSSSRRP